MHRSQPIWRIAVTVSVTLGLAGAFAAACGGSDNNDCSDPSCGGGDGGGDGSKPPGGGAAGCKAAGLACTVATDCCNLVCNTDGTCSAGACINDNDACTTAGSCCSGNCTGGKCVPLTTTCKTSGNGCATNDECCSKLCVSGFCSLTSSYCAQVGDVCSKGADCCSGLCNIAAGATLGACGTPPTGPSDCHGVDGVVCNDCTDCCSRTCVPYAATGVKICQPAEGCHVTGDLCTKNTDCCGGGAKTDPTDPTHLPGDGNVTCDFSSGIPGLGICRNPLSCNPEGNICHFKDYTCGSSSARNDCCEHLGAATDCELDKLGVPRCHAITTCRKAGEVCASSADCCDGTPCVPDSSGVLRCGAAPCVPTAGGCTTDADCCSGLTCTHPLGSTTGTCGGAPPPPPPPDGGTYDAPDAVDGAYTCSLYGQTCKVDGDCCDGVPCLDAANAPCGATPTGSCTCHYGIR